MTLYHVTDTALVTTAAKPELIDAIKAARAQLQASVYTKDERAIRYELEESGELKEIGRFTKAGGRIVHSFHVIKFWKNEQERLKRPCTLTDYYRAVDVCPKCRGDKGRHEFDLRAQDYIITETCPHCKGEGNFVVLKEKVMELVVRELIYASEGGKKQTDIAVESGTGATCMKCFKDIKEMYTGDAQFRIEENGKIVAIQVHGEMLWLDNVPPPAYFTPKYKLPKELRDGIEAGIKQQETRFITQPTAASTATSPLPQTLCMAGWEGVD